MQENPTPTAPRKAGVGAYIALLFAVIFFSGISVSGPVKNFGTTIAQQLNVEPKKVHDIFSVFDFNTLNGKFGKVVIPDTKAKEPGTYTTGNFSGEGGVGARQGFMFALTLVPTTLLAMGIIAVLEHYGALEAMRRLLQRILRPLMGIPGDTGLAMIASFQSTDAGAALTRALYDQGQINAREREIFCMFQFSAGATITNFLGSGAALLALTSVAADGTTQGVPTTIGICFAVLFLFKFFGANLMRLYLNLADRKAPAQPENPS
ncbi:nucleoside recognition domain-containing protein [Cardiobacterium valvarum]|uniref:Transporter gate domain protein n=1 Tax=Cardiobacterium valvarum F0432 TaxID=797473 RepID=G9ZFK2_9GAMM|nr:nucleoside recognition domain-containing protein [Cardiobacterium valvarum]EHM53891.1 transporter gate domain protein [Cardiobacterium valvarum F0432]